MVPVKNAEGAVIDQRIDNLIHASATDCEAEREIKLWFKPNEIPAALLSFETRIAEQSFYLKDGKLITEYKSGSTPIIAAGDIVWKSDMDILYQLISGHTPSGTLELVAAKYLLNRE